MSKKLEIQDLEELNIENTVVSENWDINKPGIPYKGKAIMLPQQMKPLIAEYSIGIPKTPTTNYPDLSRITGQMRVLMACQNNITEILAYISLIQNRKSKEKLENITNEVDIILEKQFGKIIEQLEQNRLNIKKELEEIKLYSEEKHETLYQNQQRIINQINEIKNEKN